MRWRRMAGGREERGRKKVTDSEEIKWLMRFRAEETAKATHPREEPQERPEVLVQLLPLTSHHDPTEEDGD